MAVVGISVIDRVIERFVEGPLGRLLEVPSVRAAAAAANGVLLRMRHRGRRLVPASRRVARSNPGVPTIAVASFVQNAAHLLPIALSPELRSAVDEIVVLDGGSNDDTAAVARSLGARVVDAPFPPEGFGLQQTRAAQAVESDWVLLIDADEMASSALLAALPSLVRQKAVTGWWLPRRWIVESGRGGFGWLASRPHWPDWQPRLARRIPSLAYVGSIHQTLSPSTRGPWGFATGAPLLHLDLAITSRESRERKVSARSGISGFRGTECFYLWEDWPTRVEPIPPPDARRVIAETRLLHRRSSGQAD